MKSNLNDESSWKIEPRGGRRFGKLLKLDCDEITNTSAGVFCEDTV